MKPAACVTTSWDDGHPLDVRVAELLTKYGLRGTFYVPMSAETGTMTAAQVRELGTAFEIGAHTVHHVDLTVTPDQQCRQELVDSKRWVEDVTGRPCSMFCPPKGHFSARHVPLVREAGYIGMRTVELLSVDFPRSNAGLLLQPTTVQAHPHGWSAYARNATKRGAWRNFWHLLLYGRSADWVALARSLLDRVAEQGGVFHLWGHPWEVEQTGQWPRLEEALRLMGQVTRRAPALTNTEVCETVVSERRTEPPARAIRNG
jgi:peptidoglycan/xylan/chitin deacetylase (PgdA/CDA1 family)